MNVKKISFQKKVILKNQTYVLAWQHCVFKLYIFKPLKKFPDRSKHLITSFGRSIYKIFDFKMKAQTSMLLCTYLKLVFS